MNNTKPTAFPNAENKQENGNLKKEKFKDVLLFVFLGLTLFVLAWLVFRDDAQKVEDASVMSETESKVARILKEIDGVGEADVIVCETEDEIVSVVVVCEGANDLRVIMDVREAVSAALGTPEKSIKIFLKKE